MSPRNPARPSGDGLADLGAAVARWIADARPLDADELARLRVVLRPSRGRPS